MILFLSRSLSLSAQGCVGRAGWGATWCVRTAMGRWSLTVSVIQTSSRWPCIRAETKTAPPTGWSKSGSRWAARLHCTNEAFIKGSFNDSPPAMCFKSLFYCFEQCNATCGRGVKRRQVVCAGLEAGVFKEFPERMCDRSLRPTDSTACFERPCSKWFTTSWSQVRSGYDRRYFTRLGHKNLLCFRIEVL